MDFADVMFVPIFHGIEYMLALEVVELLVRFEMLVVFLIWLICRREVFNLG